MANYWEEETPIIVITNKNRFKLFKEAGKLQVSTPEWVDKNGIKKFGKAVIIDINALLESKEAVEMFNSIFKK